MLLKYLRYLKRQLRGHRDLKRLGIKYSADSLVKRFSNTPQEKLIKDNPYLLDINVESLGSRNSLIFNFFLANALITIEKSPVSNAQFVCIESEEYLTQLHLDETKLGSIIPITFLVRNFKILLPLLVNRQQYLSRLCKFNGKLSCVFERKTHLIINEPRYFIPHQLDRISFLSQLHNRGFNYVVLRWFNQLPYVDNLDEDIDILVSDEDLCAIQNYCNSFIGIYPLDLYSVSGDHGSSWAGMPYYPKELALNMLESSQVFNNSYKVPDAYHHLVSLAFHAVFHKGLKSGLPASTKSILNEDDLDHNYIQELSRLLHFNGFTNYSLTLDGMSTFLKDQKLNPHIDQLLKYKQHTRDQWIIKKLQVEKELIEKEFKPIKGLTVFIIRQKAYTEANVNYLLDQLAHFGFHSIEKGEIIRENINATNSIRGGNWNSGPFETSGGEPRYFIIALDPFIQNPSLKVLKLFPDLENEKLAVLKTDVRNYFYHSGDSFNGLHTSDNFYESIQYSKILLSQKQVENIYKQASSIYDDYHFDFLEIFSNYSKRCRVGKILYKNKLAVLKAFNKINGLRHYHREKEIYLKFKNCPYVPALLDYTDNSIVIEYLDGYVPLSALKSIEMPLIDKVKEIFEFLRSNNIAIIDFHPKNILVNENDDLKLIDFEFAVFIDTPVKLIDSYDLQHMPESFKGDLPYGYSRDVSQYELHWKPLFNITLEDFCNA